MAKSKKLEMNLFNIPVDGHDKEELRLVKSALLYGDEVHLYNPMYSIREGSVRRYVTNFANIAISTQRENNISDVFELDFDSSESNEDLDDDFSLLEFEEDLDDDFDLLNGYFPKKSLGYYMCKFSLESLRLVLDVPGPDDNEFLRNKEFINRCIAYYSAYDKNKPLPDDYKIIPTTLLKIKTTKDYLDLDRLEAGDISNLVDTFFKQLTSCPSFSFYSSSIMNSISSKNTMQDKSYAFADYLFSLLPAFDEASLDEILDIRKELSKQLISFRASMLDYSDAIQGIPHTEDFNVECKRLYHKKIAPEIEEIYAAISDNNIFANIFKKIVSEKDFWAGLSCIALSVLQNNEWLSTASAISASVFGARALSASLIEAHAKQKTIRKNGLYFYYKANKLLSG